MSSSPHAENNQDVAQLNFPAGLDKYTTYDLQLLSRRVSPPIKLDFSYRTVGTSWKIYHFKTSVSYLLCNKDKLPPNTGSPSSWTHTSIHLPNLLYRVTDDNFERLVLEYSAFDSLRGYLDRKPNSKVAPDCLPILLKNYIMGLYGIHDMRKHLGEIAEVNLIVYRDKRMFLRPASAKTRINTPYEFMELGFVLDRCFRRYPWYKTGEPVHETVKLLMKCDTCEKCQWMKYAPYILTADEKVRLFIPKMNDIAKVCQRFRKRLAKAFFSWKLAVSVFGNAELTMGFNDSRYAPYHGWNNDCGHCLRFLRNSIAHLHDNVCRPQNHCGTFHSHYSNLLLDSHEFVRLMNTFSDDILNSVFTIAAFHVRLPCLAEAENTTFKKL